MPTNGDIVQVCSAATERARIIAGGVSGQHGIDHSEVAEGLRSLRNDRMSQVATTAAGPSGVKQRG